MSDDADLIISMLKLKREIMVQKLKRQPPPTEQARSLIELKVATYNEIIHTVNEVFEDFENPILPPV